MREPTDYQVTAPVAPAAVLSRRCYGTLNAITDSERRALRSIGATAREVAARTGALLTGLLAMPGVRIFQGVRPLAGDLPCIPHVVSAGHGIILVDSVAWPPGRYTATSDGRIHCDGVYIGQSVVPLIAAARHWRNTLAPGHEVSAVVVVYPAIRGDLILPAAIAGDLNWACADLAIHAIQALLPQDRQLASLTAVAALADAVDDE